MTAWSLESTISTVSLARANSTSLKTVALQPATASSMRIRRGVPVRVEIGPRDVAAMGAVYYRRDRPVREKHMVSRAELVQQMPQILDEIQRGLFERAARYRAEHTRRIDTWDEFVAFFTPKNTTKPEPHGGFALSHWSGDAEAEERAKQLKVTIRCIPLDAEEEPGKCIITGKPSRRRVVFGKSY
jgi:prolyl-tRNA synthetase